MTAIVQFTDVEKYYGNFHALKKVTTSFEDGSITCIIGPSGSGKSTLLRCINALETIDDGYLEVLGEHIGYVRHGADLLEATSKELARQRSSIGMVFQRFNLFPHLTVMENVTVGQMTVKGMPPAEAETIAMEQLRNVGMDAFGHRYPEELSGGQMQRVAIARALAMRPKLMLFDEPTSALDPELVNEVLEVMRGLKRTGIAMIVVTHELTFARDVADTIVFMEGGVIVETGPAREVLTAPQSPRTKEFIAQVRT